MSDLVLIDTGVWIDYLHGHSSVIKLQTLLEDNLACTHTWIEGELRRPAPARRRGCPDWCPTLAAIRSLCLSRPEISGPGAVYVNSTLHGRLDHGEEKILLRGNHPQAA